MNSEADLNGSIEFLAVAGILKDLYQRRATGELLLTDDDRKKGIYLKNGIIIYATSNAVEDRLGAALLANNVITQPQFDESSRQVIATGKKQGTILVQMGALSPKDLFNGLNLQVRGIILSLFTWERGRYSFTDKLPPQEEIITLRIMPAPIIFEGIVGQASRKEQFSRMWDVSSLTIRPHPDPPWILEDLRLPNDTKKILFLLEKGTPLPQLPSLVGLSEEDTVAFLYALSVLDLVSTDRAPPRPGASIPEPEPAEAESLPTRSKIESLHSRIGKLNFYQVLRLEPGASGDSIKRAYLMMAKDFHPDRFFEDEYADLKDKITAIFMRINEAYTILSDAGRKAEYDRKEIRLETTSRDREAPLQDSQVAREQFKRGMESLKTGDLWKAVDLFRWAVHINPKDPLYHSWLGAALTRSKKRLHEAEEHCRTAISLDYSNPLYYLHLGQVYKAGRLFKKAGDQFKKALKLDPGNAGAREELESLDLSPEDKRFLRRLSKK